MERRPEIRYINANVCGTSAYQLDMEPVRKKRVKLPKAQRKKKLVVYLDPFALLGILTAGIMMVMLIVGAVRLQDSRNEVHTLENYVHSLQQENLQLQDTYLSSFDLEEIKQIATAMGMVPSSEVTQISMDVVLPPAETEPTAWENFCAFLAGLFA